MLRSPLMKLKVESEKVGLKLKVQKTNIMASGPITSWQIDGETVEQCQTLFFGAPKSLQMVTAAMKIKRCLLLGRKVLTYLDSILKSRHYFANKGPSPQSYVFLSSPVWM